MYSHKYNKRRFTVITIQCSLYTRWSSLWKLPIVCHCGAKSFATNLLTTSTTVTTHRDADDDCAKKAFLLQRTDSKDDTKLFWNNYNFLNKRKHSNAICDFLQFCHMYSDTFLHKTRALNVFCLDYQLQTYDFNARTKMLAWRTTFNVTLRIY